MTIVHPAYTNESQIYMNFLRCMDILNSYWLFFLEEFSSYFIFFSTLLEALCLDRYRARFMWLSLFIYVGIITREYSDFS